MKNNNNKYCNEQRHLSSKVVTKKSGKTCKEIPQVAPTANLAANLIQRSIRKAHIMQGSVDKLAERHLGSVRTLVRIRPCHV